MLDYDDDFDDYYDDEDPNIPTNAHVTPIQGPIFLKNGSVPVVPLYSYPQLNNGTFVQIPVSFSPSSIFLSDKKVESLSLSLSRITTARARIVTKGNDRQTRSWAARTFYGKTRDISPRDPEYPR